MYQFLGRDLILLNLLPCPALSKAKTPECDARSGGQRKDRRFQVIELTRRTIVAMLLSDPQQRTHPDPCCMLS